MTLKKFAAVLLIAAACIASPLDAFVRVYTDIKRSSFLDEIMSNEPLFMKMCEKANLENCLSLIYYGLVLEKTSFQPSAQGIKEVLAMASQELGYSSHQNWYEFISGPGIDRARFHDFFVKNAKLLPGGRNYLDQVDNLLLQGLIESEDKLLCWCSSTLTSTRPKRHAVITHTDNVVFALMLIFHTPEDLIEGLVQDWWNSVGKENPTNHFCALFDTLKVLKSTDDRLRAFIEWLVCIPIMGVLQTFQRFGHLRALFEKAVQMRSWNTVSSILYQLVPFQKDLIDYVSFIPREHLCEIDLKHRMPAHRYFQLFVVARFKSRDHELMRWYFEGLHAKFLMPESIAVNPYESAKFGVPAEILRLVFGACCENDPLQVIFDLPLVCKDWYRFKLAIHEVMAAGKQFSLFMTSNSSHLSRYDLGPFKRLILEGIRCVVTAPDLIDEIQSYARTDIVSKLLVHLDHLHFGRGFRDCYQLIEACRAVTNNGFVNINIPSSWNNVEALSDMCSTLADRLDCFDEEMTNFELTTDTALTLFFKVLAPPRFDDAAKIGRLRNVLLHVLPNQLGEALFTILTSATDYPHDQVIAFIKFVLKKRETKSLVPFYTDLYQLALIDKQLLVGRKSSDLVPLLLAKMIASGQFTEKYLLVPMKEYAHLIIPFLAVNPILSESELPVMVKLLSKAVGTVSEAWVEEKMFEENAGLLSELVAHRLQQ